jgi:hypothetical protein
MGISYLSSFFWINARAWLLVLPLQPLQPLQPLPLQPLLPLSLVQWASVQCARYYTHTILRKEELMEVCASLKTYTHARAHSLFFLSLFARTGRRF